MDAQQETIGITASPMKVGVVMRREPVQGDMRRWQAFRWVLADVVPHDDLPDLAKTSGSADAGQPIPIEPTDVQPPQEGVTHWLYPGFDVELFRDDAEGYYLNLTSPQPCFWVLWRLPDGAPDDAFPQPLIVTVSYHDAGRWLDAQERVDQVPAPPSVLSWMAAFTQQHYRVEAKKRKRPASFQPLTDRFGNPVSISTEKIRGGGPHG